MPSYLSPGVYVEEVASGNRPISGVGTGMAGFIGLAPQAGAHLNEAVRIGSWTQFCKEFVGDAKQSTPLACAVHGFLVNGGQTCQVVNIGANGALATGIAELERIDEVAILAAPGFTDAASYDALLTSCEKLRDRFAILDSPAQVASIEALTQVATAEAKPKKDAAEGAAPAAGTRKAVRPRMSPFGAVYFPHVTIKDPITGELVEAAPSGHLAGIYARTDALRGVHKAPANEIIRGAVGVSYRVSREEQGSLNPAGVNCIRFFETQGVMVWGARTLDQPASEYRYIPVRRFVNMVSESIEEALHWVVFETNHEPLWKAIRRDITAFLTLLWRQGMLKGATAEEAFYVKCDAESNPEEVIAAGQVVTQIGLSVVKPAEFVVIRISQNSGLDTPDAKA